VRIVGGDAHNVEEVKKLFEGEERVELVVSSLGAKPTEASFSLTGGFKLLIPDVCTRANLVLLEVLQDLPYPPPCLVAISSTGVGKSHSELPLFLKPLYAYLLSGPHADKLGLEYTTVHASSSLSWPSSEDVPSSDILPAGSLHRIKPGFLDEVVIVRPALLTDGEKTGIYRTGEKLGGAYRVSRKDVGDFVGRELVPGKREWVNKVVCIAY